MKTILTALILFTVCRAADPSDPSPLPAAILPFAERGAGVEGEGSKVSDILFAELLLNPAVHLIDREDLQRQLKEQELGKLGLVQGEDAAQVGRLTGAKLLISGSVIEAGSRLYLVAKITGTETGKMLGAKTDGAIDSDLGSLVKELAEQVNTVLSEKAHSLLPEAEEERDPVALLTPHVKDRNLPTVYISRPSSMWMSLNTSPERTLFRRRETTWRSA